MLAVLATTKPTVGEKEVEKHIQFTQEYSQDG